MKHKIHKSIIPLFTVALYYCSDSETLTEKFNLEHHTDSFGGFCWHDVSAGYVGVYLPHDKGSVIIPHLVHESLHAAGYVADILGLEPTNTANESTAHIAEWISGKILDFANSEREL